MKGLRTRATSAVIFVILTLGGILGGSYSFLTLFTVVTAFCLFEFLKMVLDRYKRRDLVRIGLGIMLGLLPHLFFSYLLLNKIVIDVHGALSIAIILMTFIFLMFIYELFANSKTPFENVAMMVTGVVYIGVPFAMLDYIAFRSGNFEWQIVLGVLLLTWLSDTGAYLSGSQFGSTKLFPRISPNKTWEGFIGGAILVLCSSQFLAYFFPLLTWVNWLILSVIVIIFGSLGDLVESMLKRSLGVKDSGNILPGHGGLLDRFDAFIFLLPFVAAYLMLIR